MIPITKPLIGRAEADAAAEAVMSGWLTQGPRVAEFETVFARVVGADRASAVANCTVALHLALLAAGVGPGDEVVTVSHTFIACANAIRQCGATPIFVDIDPITFNGDPDEIGKAINRRTKAILCVHQMGMPCDLGRIIPIARAHGIAVVEDAACALGSQVLWGETWQPIGAPIGDVACFSFHPRKVITVGDGGMLTTRHPEWNERFRLWRQHGMSVPDTVRHQSNQVIFESYPDRGFNYRLTDVQAAIGLKQLDRLPYIVERRRQLAQTYRELLKSDVPDVKAPEEPAWARSNWQSYCVRLPDGLDQRSVMQRMLDRGVATRRGIMCIHLEQAYSGHPPRFSLAESERAQRQCILLPLFPEMTFEMQRQVVDALREATRADRNVWRIPRSRHTSARALS